MSALHQKDVYKVGHVFQYPEGTTEIYSNMTARSGAWANPNIGGIVFVGLQYVILDYLIRDWNTTFFNQKKSVVCGKYKRRVDAILGTSVDISHIEALHDLGYLPVNIKALPEGAFVPYGVPFMTIKNTLPEFYWVTNMLECVLSNELWLPITSATTYFAFRELFLKYATLTCGIQFVPYQGHDFSFRGMAGRKAAAISGFAVLAAGCRGTDNIPAIDLAEDYYKARCEDTEIGTSIPASEHSVMSCGGREDEEAFLRHLLTNVYPEGPVSIVSDTWDFWHTVTKILPKLRDVIMNRNGKLVVRPDSGDPVDIIAGTGRYEDPWHIQKGLVATLACEFGYVRNAYGFKELDPHLGVVYGDSITYERAEAILRKLHDSGFATNNVVFGIGSYTYQHVTRDVHGIAVKSTHAVINGKSVPIYKDPVTSKTVKKSAKGYLMVSRIGNTYELVQEVSVDQERHGCLQTVFLNGELRNEQTFMDVRERVDKAISSRC